MLPKSLVPVNEDFLIGSWAGVDVIKKRWGGDGRLVRRALVRAPVWWGSYPMLVMKFCTRGGGEGSLAEIEEAQWRVEGGVYSPSGTRTWRHLKGYPLLDVSECCAWSETGEEVKYLQCGEWRIRQKGAHDSWRAAVPRGRDSGRGGRKGEKPFWFERPTFWRHSGKTKKTEE